MKKFRIDEAKRMYQLGRYTFLSEKLLLKTFKINENDLEKIKKNSEIISGEIKLDEKTLTSMVFTHGCYNKELQEYFEGSFKRRRLRNTIVFEGFVPITQVCICGIYKPSIKVPDTISAMFVTTDSDSTTIDYFPLENWEDCIDRNIEPTDYYQFVYEPLKRITICRM